MSKEQDGKGETAMRIEYKNDGASPWMMRNMESQDIKRGHL